MNPSRYTYLAGEAGTRYQTVLHAFTALLATSSRSPFSNAVADTLRADAWIIANSYFNTEGVLIRQDMTTTAQEALRSAHNDLLVGGAVFALNDLQSAFLEQSATHLEREIYAQLTRDVEAVVARYRSLAVEALLVGKSKASPSGVPTFDFRDRAGRASPSARFIQTTWRFANVILAVEFYAMEAADLGAKTLTVVTADSKSFWSGHIVDLTQPNDFLEIRDEVFHPNSDATLRASF